MRRLSFSLFFAVALAGISSTDAHASEREVVVLPIQVEPVPAGTPVDLQPAARNLARILSGAVEDYGFSLAPVPAVDAPVPDAELPAHARDHWVLAATLGLAGEDLSLRVVVVRPGSRVLWVRREQFPPELAEVRSLGLLRELLEPGLALPRECPESDVTRAQASSDTHSEGRAVLALHTAALGGYLGFSLQRATGSNEARLTYPLAALGAGIGLGSAVIVAEEWNIDIARAWYLGAGIVWPGLATLLLLEPDHDSAEDTRHLLGIAGALGGVTLATAGLALGDVDEGGAALTHSGAVLGMVLGGLGELIIEGDARAEPRQGLGFGVLTGVVAAGALAVSQDVPSATDLLFVDLSALLGGLAGAALGTPILVTDISDRTRDRLWLSTMALGTVAGASLGYWISSSPTAPEPARAGGAKSGLEIEPQLGWLGHPLGFGVSGSW